MLIVGGDDMEGLTNIRIHGVYEHFKGGRYLVQALAEHANTGEKLVVYRQINTGKVYVRPLNEFTETVERDAYKGPRFKLIII